MDEFSTDDFDVQELCNLLSECEQRPNGSGNDKMEEIINTNENNMNNKNCVSRSKQDVTDIIRCVAQHQVGDCVNDMSMALITRVQFHMQKTSRIPASISYNHVTIMTITRMKY